MASANLAMVGSQASNHHQGEHHRHSALKVPSPDKVGKWERHVLQLTIAPCSCQIETELVSYRKVNVNVTSTETSHLCC